MSQTVDQATTFRETEWRRVWKIAKIPLIIVLFLVTAAIILTLLQGSKAHGRLDPEAYEPHGSRALATILGEQGVNTTVARTFAAAEQNLRQDTDSLIITQPNLLAPQQISQLRTQAKHLILIAPEQEVLDAVAPQVKAEGNTGVQTRSAHCPLPEAQAAGTATLGGMQYSVPNPTANSVLCYNIGPFATLVRTTSEFGDLTIVGGGELFTNNSLAVEGNAALAMRLLGQSDSLVWYLPSARDPALADEDKSLTELIPQNWVFATVQLGVAVILLAIWRARRLGAVVTESLPSVVRASETTEGRARLYRRGRATDHAAGILRANAVRRLTELVGLGRNAEAPAVVDAVAPRTGRNPVEIYELLYGAPPTTEPALVSLADALDAVIVDVAEGNRRD